MAIADNTRRHPDKVNLFEIPDNELAALKDLFRYRQTLVDKLKGVKNRQKVLKCQGDAASAAAKFIRRDTNNKIMRLGRSIAECVNAMKEVIRSDAQLEQNYEHVKSIKVFGLVVTVARILTEISITDLDDCSFHEIQVGGND